MKNPALKLDSTICFADILPDGDGGFRVRPRKPLVAEVGCVAAAKLLGFKSRSSVLGLLDDPVASKIIRWRHVSPKRRSKILLEVESLLAYLEASKNFSK